MTAIRLFKGLMILAVPFVLALNGQTSRADPFAFGAGGLATPSPGDTLSISTSLSESSAGAVGDHLFGVGYVSSISDLSKSGALVWAQGVGGQGRLTFTFNNFTATSVTPTLSGATFKFSGGNLNVYYDASIVHSLSSSMGTNSAPDGNGTWATGTPILTGSGIPGILAGDPTTTLASSITPATTPFTGNGNGNFAVTGGSGPLDSFLSGQNLFLSSTFSSPDPNGVPAGSSPWPVGSTASSLVNSPASVAAVPEPGSLLLWSAVGVVGLCFARRKLQPKLAA